MSDTYESAKADDKSDDSNRQNNLIKKEYDSFLTSNGIPQLFARLTFSDNRGSVKNMENYIFGDENEFAENDDGAYEANIYGDPEEPEPEPAFPSPPQPDYNTYNTCVICLVNPKTTMLEPCNHVKFCKSCIDILMLPRFDLNNDPIIPKCPICRADITGTREFFI